MFVRAADKSLFDDMWAAWKSLPIVEGQKVPKKSALHPRLLKAHLANLGIGEHTGDGKANFRLLGESARNFWGKELTVRTYDDLAAQLPDGVMMAPAVVEALFNQPCGIETVREAEDITGQKWRVDMLSLPFADEAGEAKYMLAGFRLYLVDDIPLESDWLPSLSDIFNARLISVGFVDVGCGVPT